MGSISDVELTRESGFLKTIDDKPGISIMADRGFTIRGMLDEIGVKLNMSPFLDGWAQLPAKEIQERRKDCLITDTCGTRYWQDEKLQYSQGNHSHYHGSSDQPNCVCVCGFLSNFQPALVPPLEIISESDIEDYFQDMSDDSNDELDIVMRIIKMFNNMLKCFYTLLKCCYCCTQS